MGEAFGVVGLMFCAFGLSTAVLVRRRWVRRMDREEREAEDRALDERLRKSREGN